jgi:hypothetical protein
MRKYLRQVAIHPCRTPLTRYIERMGILTSNDSSHITRVISGYPSVMARIYIPPYALYFLVLVPILIIDLRDHALMRYDIIEGFCSYLCSCACEVV